jgi:hypothetical protein
MGLEMIGSENKDVHLSPCPPSHLGTWLCEGGGHGSETAVSGKLASQIFYLHTPQFNARDNLIVYASYIALIV